MENKTPLPNLVFLGAKELLLLPDGNEIEIRENNGEDEGILSRLKDALEGTSINNYLASIITQDLSSGNPGKLSSKDILGWKTNCKNFTLMKARILSIGDKFKFNFTCGNTKCAHKETYEEDLIPFVTPYSEINPQGIKPYPLKAQGTHEYTIPSSGRKVKFDILTGIAEKISLDTHENNIDKNHGLRIRNLAIYHENQWELVCQFAMFSSKELIQLRAEVSRVDPDFDPQSLITCPKCSKVTLISILGEPSFFYPTEI